MVFGSCQVDTNIRFDKTPILVTTVTHLTLPLTTMNVDQYLAVNAVHPTYINFNLTDMYTCGQNCCYPSVEERKPAMVTEKNNSNNI